MNVAQCIAHLESRFGIREETGIQPEDIEDWIGTALERTKEWALENGHKADLQREDTILLSAGDATTPSSAAIPSDMLGGRITRVRHASSAYDFSDIGSVGRLALVFADGFGYFAIDQAKVFMKGPAGAADPLDGSGVVTGIFAPVLGTLPAKLTPHFLDELVELAAERKHINPVGPNQEGKATA